MRKIEALPQKTVVFLTLGPEFRFLEGKASNCCLRRGLGESLQMLT